MMFYNTVKLKWKTYRPTSLSKKRVQSVLLYGNWKGMITEYEWGIPREIISPVRYHDKLKYNFITCRGHRFIHFQWLTLSLEMPRFDSQLKHKRKNYLIEKDKKSTILADCANSFCEIKISDGFQTAWSSLIWMSRRKKLIFNPWWTALLKQTTC